MRRLFEKLTAFLPRFESPLWRGIVLLSLVMNFIVIGLVIGAGHDDGRGRFGREFSRNEPPPTMGIGHILSRDFIMELPKEQRLALRELFQKNRNTQVIDGEAQRLALENVASILEQPSLDAVKLDAALALFWEEREQRESLLRKDIVGILATLDQARRQKLSSKLRSAADLHGDDDEDDEAEHD